MNCRYRFLILAVSLLCFTQAAVADDGAVLALMEKVADWQLAHPKPKENPDGWVNAAFYTGVMALARDSASPRFHDAMVKIGGGQSLAARARPFIMPTTRPWARRIWNFISSITLRVCSRRLRNVLISS